VRSPLFVRSLILLVLAGVPQSARAQIVDPPSPANSTIPKLVSVMGRNSSGVADPISQFTVTYRDLANNPVAGALIVVDFGACAELRLCSESHDPNVVVDCASRTVRQVTDANGVAIFRVAGWSVAAPGTPGTGYNAGRIYADGVLLGSPTVAIYDLDMHGLGASDLSALLSDLFSGNNAARGDYDASGQLGASDLSTWLRAYFAGGSTTNCLPEGPCP
jgi:hypothetical protein